MKSTDNTADSAVDLFPSFDAHVTDILRNFLNIPTEANDIICKALCHAGCTTWPEFRLLSAAFITCLDHVYRGKRVPLFPSLMFRLNNLAAYMDHLDDTLGTNASLDFSNYDPNDFATFRVTHSCGIPFYHPVPPPTVPSFATTCPPAAPTASPTRVLQASAAPPASPPRALAAQASPPRAFAAQAAESPASPTRALVAHAISTRALVTTSPTCAPAAAPPPPLCVPVSSPTCALAAPAAASTTCDTAAAVSPTTCAPTAPPHTTPAYRTLTALTHVPVPLSCPPALSFLPGAFSAVDSFGSLTRRHRDAITTQLYHLYTPVMIPSPLHVLLSCVDSDCSTLYDYQAAQQCYERCNRS